MKPVFDGIGCTFAHEGLRKTIRQVLRQIKKRQPQDYARIKTRLWRFLWLPRKKEGDGTMGEIRPWEYYRRSSNREIPQVYYWETPCEGIQRDGVVFVDGRWIAEIFLSRSLVREKRWKQRATISHELGHVATTEEALVRTNLDPEGEWASELAADWFADCRWSFKAEIRRDNKNRDFLHHLGGPGTEFGEYGIQYQISDDYVVNKIGTYDEKKLMEEYRRWQKGSS